MKIEGEETEGGHGGLVERVKYLLGVMRTRIQIDRQTDSDINRRQ